MSVDDTHPYQIHFDKDRYHHVREMVEWCFEHVGEGYHKDSDPWRLITAFGKSSWLFKNQNDATMFALRWV